MTRSRTAARDVRSRRGRWSLRLSNLLLTCGAGLLLFAIAAYAHTSLRQVELKRAWDERPVLPSAVGLAEAPLPESPSARDSVVRPREGEPVGRIEIPRLKVDAVVLEGISRGTLAVAPGHYPGMALPGDGGHTVLSAHRDSFFKDLGKLEFGDAIALTRADGRRVDYEVARTYIVHQSNRRVIVPRDEEVLTLITCYPFRYAGAAPYRFIVEARPAPS